MRPPIKSLLKGSLVVALSLMSAGCTEKACLRWNANDRDNEAANAATGGAGGAGGAGGSGGTTTGTGGTGGTGGANAEPPPIVCPSRARAMELLGEPSCTESIESLDTDGEFDPETDQCCYEVTTKTHPCGVK